MNSTIVVDTNVLLSSLNLIDELLALESNYHHVIVVPSEVTRELDGLKNSGSTKVASEARRANNWLYGVLAQSKPGIRGQRNDEKLDTLAKKDDGILDCCLYFQRAGHSVVLISNDRNLCIKSLTHNIPTVTYQPGLEATETAAMIARQAGIVDIHVPDVDMEIDDMEEQEHHHTELNTVDTVETLEPPESNPAPPPRHMKYSRYKLVHTLETDVYETLMENTRTLCIYQMKTWWTQEEMNYFVPTPISAEDQILAILISKFGMFAQVLPKEIMDTIKASQYPTRPTNRNDWPYFIEFWGAVCMWLSVNDTRYRRMAERVEKLYIDFYTPPSRPTSGTTA